MSLASRIDRLVATLPPKEAKWHCITVISEAEAEAREAEMWPAVKWHLTTVCCILLGQADADQMVTIRA